MENRRPLESRPYKIRNPKIEFFCPLCRTQRGFAYSYKLNWKNYLQIAFASLLLFPILGVKVFVVFLSLVAIMEFLLRTLLKNEIPCPYCGFDASWYKKDVKIARKKVQAFWDKKENFEQQAP